MDNTPITLKLYDENDEVLKEFTRSRIPAIYNEMASEALKEYGEKAESGLHGLDLNTPIYNFIIALFNDKPTLEELRKCSEFDDCLSVTLEVQTRAVNKLNQMVAQYGANPTRPSPKKK